MEIEYLLENIYELTGYDFRQYAYPSMRRRIWHRMNTENITEILALNDKVVSNLESMNLLIKDLLIHVTEMFRDPEVFLAFRHKVIPILRTYPQLRIWHAGCSTGEEVYSLAILLHEEGLYERSKIYATDVSQSELDRAADGEIYITHMKKNTMNYLKSGGKDAFSQYYAAQGNKVRFKSFLRKNITFAKHNLVTDGSFNEFHVILCRNVLIYFNKMLQNQVHGLIYESLATQGYLMLGTKESIRFTQHADKYIELEDLNKLYRKIR